MESLISVIVPVYNGGKTLSKCLNSLINQTYKNYEIIVVDNNSTDDTKRLIEEFISKEKRIKYVFEPHKSRGAARNTGVVNSKGSIVVMTDSDCIAPEKWIEEITQLIRNGKESIVQGSELDLIGNYITEIQQQSNQSLLNRSKYGNRYVNHLDTKNFAIRKDILMNLGNFNREAKSLEDFEFKIKLNKKGYKIYFLENLRVFHHHKDRPLKLLIQQINRGYWSYKIYKNNRDYAKTNKEDLFHSICLNNFLRFLIFSLYDLLKYHNKKYFFELSTGVAWRIGIIGGIISG